MKNNSLRRAVVLLSGGLDSAVTLYSAIKQGYQAHCLIFDYGQRHNREIRSALSLAKRAGCAWDVLKIALPWKGSSLLDERMQIPQGVRVPECQSVKVSKCQSVSGIPSTYVPARNLIFLSFAVSCAEAIEAQAIFIGAHSQDYSGYPDCRPEFFRALQRVIRTGTKRGAQGRPPLIKTPLLRKTKSQIIRLGEQLGVPFELTWSCYRGKARPCGGCDSCLYRIKGFNEAGLRDPLVYER